MLKFLDISVIKDSTHKFNWPTKMTKKVTWAIYRPGEKSKRILESWNWTC